LLQTRWEALGRRHQGGSELRATWFEHWRRLWPAASRRTRAQVETLAEALQTPPGVAVANPAADRLQRAQWRTWLTTRFRQMPRAPVTSMLYLFLVEQDLERLRGELLQRRMFPDHPGENGDVAAS
jgi:hypothetical protein